MIHGDYRNWGILEKEHRQKRMTDGVERAPKLWAEFHLRVEVKHDFLSGFFMAYCPANYV